MEQFTPTHIVATGGTRAWVVPDPSLTPAAMLDPGLEVEAHERRGDWTRIVCSNGWAAWVDGRQLVQMAAPVAQVETARAPQPQPGPVSWTPPAAPSTPTVAWTPAQSAHVGSDAPSFARPVRAGLRALLTPPAPHGGPHLTAPVGVLAVCGAALVIAGSLLPFFTGGGASVNAWDIPAGFLRTDTPDPSSFNLGILLLSALLVLVPLATRRPLPAIALLAIAAPATNVALELFVRSRRTDGYPSLGAGLALVMAGGLLIAVEALRAMWAARPAVVIAQ